MVDQVPFSLHYNTLHWQDHGATPVVPLLILLLLLLYQRVTPVIIALSRSPGLETKKQCAIALARLSMDPDSRLKIVREGALQVLVVPSF